MATPAKQTVSILLYGRDTRLVQTRSWVLAREGFCVFTACQFTELQKIGTEETIDLFLLCDSLPPDARAEVLSLIHSSWPGAKRLVLTPASFTAEFEPREEVFPAMEGPHKLVMAIRTLVVNGARSAS